MKQIKIPSLPFARKALAIAAMTAVLGACSSNSDDSKNPNSDNNKGSSDLNESFMLAEMSDNGYTIELMENCGHNPQNEETSTVFQDESMEMLAGGGGIASNAYPDGQAEIAEPWDGLAHDPADPRYDLENLQAIEDDSCNGLLTKTGIVVTKYANWHHQHSNEFVPPLLNENKTFGDVKSVVLELKLNSDNTIIPSQEELATIYDDKLAAVHEAVQASLAQSEENGTDPEFSPREDIDLTDFDYDRLDQEKAVFAVALQNEATGADNVQTERYIEIDPALYADKWIRITIDFEDMDFFTGDVWVKGPTDETDLDQPVHRLHMVGEILGTGETEQQYGDVLRNYIGSPGSDAVYDALDIPETFKEMSVTLKKVEVVWK